MDLAISLLLGCWTLSLIVCCPYTKVEESFGMQAIHDILFHGTNISQYDHQTFPGVVPRSFIGPLIVSLFSLPSALLLHGFTVEKIHYQYLVRLVLATWVLFGFYKFYFSLKKMFGSIVANYCCIIVATQFHFIFYASRPLPNTFALATGLLSLAAWLNIDLSKFIWLSAIAIIIFRFELCILFGVCLVILFFRTHVDWYTLLTNIALSGIFALGLTVAVDSYFWKRWLWPEGEVMWYNVVLNKSSNWGTSPFHWARIMVIVFTCFRREVCMSIGHRRITQYFGRYFTSALPRALLTSVLFVPWGVKCDPHRSSVLLLPAISFVLAFSLLPHKELRFIIYTFPLFSVVAARGYADLHLRRKKSPFWGFVFSCSLACLLLNFAACIAFLAAAMNNYPGGQMLSFLHEKIPCDPSLPSVHVHITNYAAQTGVSRFGQQCDHWRYNKTEHLTPDQLWAAKDLTHAILERGQQLPEAWTSDFTAIGSVEGYAGLGFHRTISGFPIYPFIRTSPVLDLWQRVGYGSL